MVSTRKWSLLSLFSKLIGFLALVLAFGLAEFASKGLSSALGMKTFKGVKALINS